MMTKTAGKERTRAFVISISPHFLLSALVELAESVSSQIWPKRLGPTVHPEHIDNIILQAPANWPSNAHRNVHSILC
jgi:hypothetical protein